MWLGNSSQAILRSEKGRALVGFFPILHKKKGMRQCDMSYYRAWLMHRCLDILLRPLKESPNGQFFKREGKDELMMPLLTCYIGDGPELKKLRLCTDVCRVCGLSSRKI
jgi:hypothetical protein